MKPRKPTRRELIVRAARDLLDRLPNIQGKDPASACWSCGWTGSPRALEHAHIVARSDGGSATPGNFFILCHTCHLEQPDRATRDAQERWILGRLDHAEMAQQHAERALDALKRDALRIGIPAEHWPLVATLWWQMVPRDFPVDSARNSRRTDEANKISAMVESFRCWTREHWI